MLHDIYTVSPHRTPTTICKSDSVCVCVCVYVYDNSSRKYMLNLMQKQLVISSAVRVVKELFVTS